MFIHLFRLSIRAQELWKVFIRSGLLLCSFFHYSFYEGSVA